MIEEIFRNPVAGSLLTFLILFSAIFVAFMVNTGFPLTAILDAMGLTDLSETIESYTISGLIGALFDYAKNSVHASLDPFNEVLASFLADGILEGVGIVSAFIPLILITLIIMSAIEDSGLGPLMAVSIHEFFSRFGLSGRAIYPLFISLGCNVPGVMASRAALDDLEKREIILGASFIPCQARLIVLLAFAYFIAPENPGLQAAIVFGVYVGGVFLYLLTAFILRRIIYRVKTSPELVLELPRLRIPSGRVVWWNSWSMTKHFIVRAGTIIVILVAIIWALSSYGPEGYVGSEITRSYAYYIGALIGSAIAPIYGLSTESSWKIGFALLNGFIAKENLLASTAVLVGVENIRSVPEALGLTISQGIAILVLFMYYIPCMATVSAIYSETRSLRFTVLAVVYIVALALAVSAIVYSLINLL